MDWDAIRLVSRGVLIFRVDVTGTPMHSSLSDQLPSRNANVSMGRLIARFAAEAPSILHYEPHALAPLGPTLNPALVAAGGVGYGILPGAASFLSDIRVLPGMTREQIEADLEAFLRRAAADDPGLDTTLAVEHWLPACEIATTSPIVAAATAAAAHVLGEAPPFAAFPGGTDAPHFQVTAGIPTIPSLGPGLLTAAHRPNESISLQSIAEATAIYAETARRFLDG